MVKGLPEEISNVDGRMDFCVSRNRSGNEVEASESG